MGFVPETCCPHYDGEKDRKPSVKQFVDNGIIDTCYAIDDEAALHYKNGSIYKAINFGHNKSVYKVFNNNESVIEEDIGSASI